MAVRLPRLGIAPKLFAGFSVVASVTGAVGIFGISRLTVLEARTDAVYAAASTPASAAESMQTQWTATLATMYASVVAPERLGELEQRAKLVDEQFDRAYATYKASAHTVEGGQIADQIAQARNLVLQVRTVKVVPAVRAGDLAAAAAAMAAPDFDRIVEALNQAGSKVVVLEHAHAKRIADEADTTYKTARISLIAMLAVGVALSLGMALLVARAFLRTVRRSHSVLVRVADGDLTARVDVRTGDELGQIGVALNASLDHVAKMVRLVGSSAAALADSSRRLTGVAGQIAAGVADAAEEATTVSGSAGEVSTSVHTVVTGTEELTSSIREIAQSAAEAVRVANDATAAANETTATMAKLEESSVEIGNVVNVITSIAAQTNLLALNATIEAARAGEAGKGFAVVASEVKDLARETAKATDDISQRIAAIQADAARAATAIERISAVIETVSGYQTSIATAVEQQTFTTNEIGRNAAGAASGSTAIAGSIDRVARAVQSTTVGVRETEAAAEELAGMSTELASIVAGFRA
jgi:methyl-accepting chemotaxis protein